MANIKKILWPIDPTSNEAKSDRSIKNFLQVLGKTISFEIQPVYILSADYFITSEYFEPIDTKALKENMRKECENYLESFTGCTIHPPLVLDNQYSAKGTEVRLFCEYVKNYQPDFVLMSSHGRKGWARAFMGSFTENFLLETQTPTIIIGPEYENITSLKRALMPVELSESSQKFVESFLDDHRLSFLEELVLFHKISMVDLDDIAWAPTLYGVGSFSGEDVLKKAKENTIEYLQAFLSHPLSGKRLSYEISEKLQPVSQEIVEEAEKGGFQVTVMRTESGTFVANVLGSVTRDVIRKSKTPVIVYPHLFKS